MALFIEIHPDNPQPRLVKQAVDIIRAGGVVIYPTDSCYALGCQIGNKNAMDRIRAIRKLGEKHNFTLVCSDLSEIATYAMVDNAAYRLLKTHTPGPYTFVLKATHEVPRRLQHPKRKTIGLRIPGNPIAQAILKELGEPLMSSTLILPDDDMPMTDPQEMYDTLGHQVDLVINGGNCGSIPTTVVEFTEGVPVVARHGLGDAAPFET
ncbi:MAG: threonylcarbamoyl-AMP synthase [Gammaproteobacteria bacterium]|nr:threonylcarbamoyl-AMP synthase [Gammaproteobacteria bacterium]